ncbi:hypothetical protein ACIO3O_37540 [Streptomyces sp. NPDC087440]|uniref:hypothetical protein n=1 Tax=Streptomyces sp. NPDC087440 TaxID=3365790 RepID=UPI0037F8AED6
MLLPDPDGDRRGGVGVDRVAGDFDGEAVDLRDELAALLLDLADGQDAPVLAECLVVAADAGADDDPALARDNEVGAEVAEELRLSVGAACDPGDDLRCPVSLRGRAR